MTTPHIIARGQHNVSRKHFSPNALKVLYRLKDSGHQAYLVGGCIRDVLLGIEPKDFDVVTDATPEQVKRLFRNCRLIGRRFRLAHIVFGREIIEVATMRGHHQAEQSTNHTSQASDEGQLLRDNVYGTIDEDAQRRDFSVNALYYDISDFSIRDFAGGMAALEARRIELIGDPETRYREDPVRMLRAVRFATKLDMTIAPATAEPIKALASLLSNIPPARLFEEMLKLFLNGKAHANFLMLREYGLLEYLFPQLDSLLNNTQDETPLQLIEQMLINTDKRISQDKKVTPAYLVAAFLWFPLQHLTNKLRDKGASPFDAINQAVNIVLSESARVIAVPKRFTMATREIWLMQARFEKRTGQRAMRLLQEPRFRAAMDFYNLRAQFSPELKDCATWWQSYAEKDQQGQKSMVAELGNSNRKPGPRKPRRRYNNKKPRKSFNQND